MSFHEAILRNGKAVLRNERTLIWFHAAIARNNEAIIRNEKMIMPFRKDVM